MPEPPVTWFVYLLECRGGAIYTGIAVDVEARFRAHLSGRGARYTRANPPLRILARLPQPDRSAASRAEAAIKRMSAQEKRALASSVAGSCGPPPASAEAGGKSRCS